MASNNDQSKYSLEKQEVTKKSTKSAQYLGFTGNVITLLIVYITLTYDMNLSANTTPDDLIDLASKLKFLLQYLTLGLTWLSLSVYFVVRVRVFSIAMNPMFGYEHLTEEAKNNLDNTLQHFLLSSVSQLILITYTEASIIVKIIPVINFLFLIGRIAFWLGYPKYRSFGITFSSMPINLMAHLLVKSGGNVNNGDSNGRTPLIMISIYLLGYDNWHNRDKFARLFIEANADPNLSDIYGLTPLMHASINGQYDYVSILLSYAKTNYEICDKAGNNAIMLAARYGQVEVLQEFKDHIMYNKNVRVKLLDKKNYNNKSALDLAYEGNYYECASLLTTLRAALVDKQRLLSQEIEPLNHTHLSNLHLNTTTLTSNDSKNSLLGHCSHKDSVKLSEAKSDDKLNRNTKNVKLPPINGNRFIGYSEWTQNNKVSSDRKTI